MATRKPQADLASTKAKKPRATKRSVRGGKRNRAAPRSDEEKTDRYLAATSGAASKPLDDYHKSTTRLGKLRAMLEPKTEDLVEAMYDIAMDKAVHPSIRMECADRLLTRLYGKPKETVDLNVNDQMATGDEMTKLLNNILAKVDAPLLEAPESPEVPATASDASDA